MRSIKHTKVWAALLGGILLGGGFATSVALWWQAERLTVVNSNGSFSVAMTAREGRAYVFLTDVLEQLGTVESSPGKSKVKLRFDSLEAEFSNEKSQARIGDNSVALNGKVLIENGRALLPAAALPNVLPHFLNTSVDYREGSRRLFLGDAGIRFALELKKGEGTELVLSFSAPVSPQISTEPGKLKMIFDRDPISMGSRSWQFDDTVITSAGYSDAAQPELVVSAGEPLLATFAGEGKTIVVMAAPKIVEGDSAGPVAATPPLEQSAVIDMSAAAPRATVDYARSERRDPYLIVIDAGHGGTERGAALSDKLAEKDVTLAIARNLRKRLEERGLSTLMVREDDATLAPDQRAVVANTSQAAVYVAIHAGGLNRGVRVYTSMLTPAEAVSEPPVPWERAQASFITGSRIVASAILAELGKNQVRVPAAWLPAPVRPLNNVTAPAVAVEVGPLGDNMETLNNADYQERIAVALVAALSSVKPQLERRP
jgi:N-acetylmuramoyl-L-alanine amidase